MATSVSATTAHIMTRWRDPLAWLATADIFAILTVVSLPWSTSLPAIFAVIWFITLLPAIKPHVFMQMLRLPACYLPIVFFALALLGMAWTEVSWGQGFKGVDPVAKLLLLPFLFYHFQNSKRGLWIFGGFLLSCTVLMLLSWLVTYDTRFVINTKEGLPGYGVPVKNYIAQSQEFALCAIALAWPILDLIRRKRMVWAGLLAVVGLGFIVNMMFVTVSRTALVTLPVMLGVFALVYLNWRGVVAVAVVGLLAVAVLWAVSPRVQAKFATIGAEFERYQTSSEVTSGGLRLEFWRKSLMFFSDAPVIGHGTGSTQMLFERAAANQTGVAAEVVANPHNQTLSVAVQWGMVGVVVLYLMWFFHLMMFRSAAPGQELAAWIGLLVVVQNFASSLFNSHLFDFHEGWMYVLGVGVAGGMVMQGRSFAGRNAS